MMWRYRALSAGWSAHAAVRLANQTRSRIGQNDPSAIHSPAASTISKPSSPPRGLCECSASFPSDVRDRVIPQVPHADFSCGAMLFQEDRGLNRDRFDITVGARLGIDNDLELRAVGIVHA